MIHRIFSCRFLTPFPKGSRSHDVESHADHEYLYGGEGPIKSTRSTYSILAVKVEKCEYRYCCRVNDKCRQSWRLEYIDNLHYCCIRRETQRNTFATVTYVHAVIPSKTVAVFLIERENASAIPNLYA